MTPSGGSGAPRAAVYDRFWRSMGGGERHSGMIAQVLSHDGVDVDLIGHEASVDVEELAARLGLDLSGCRMRVVPDVGDDAMARLSADYDLFVNATYMSRLRPRARRNAYLCFFPTPFDVDLPRWRRTAVRQIGRRLRVDPAALALTPGVGWFHPEGGRRRRWMWSTGDGVLAVAPGPARELAFDVSRLPANEPTTITVTEESAGDGDGAVVLGTAQVERTFGRVRVPLPASETGLEVHIRSDTFEPGGGDTRTLGVAVSRLRLGGELSKTSLVAMRFPWLLNDPSDLGFLESYDVVLANSSYTQEWIERLWHVKSELLFPPIDVAAFGAGASAAGRRPTILSVGRFFAPGFGHSKRQLEMVQFFGRAWRSGRLPGWEFVVVGGLEGSQVGYVDAIRHAAGGLPVRIVPNAPRDQVRELMMSASIFWSATGYGEPESAAPWAQEHFGMTTAEAMAGGCVPIVIDSAGQREIVRDGVDGYRWATADELVARTLQVATDDPLRHRLATAAMDRVQQFSDAAFAARWRALAAGLGLVGGRT